LHRPEMAGGLYRPELAGAQPFSDKDHPEMMPNGNGTYRTRVGVSDSQSGSENCILT
jgi:hypothetical protein